MLVRVGKMGYLTPDECPTDTVCRALFIPNNESFLAIVRGALEELTFPYNWTKQGDLEPEEAADCLVDMFDKFCLSNERCLMIGQLVPYAGDASPADNLIVCDGRSLLIADYTDLYVVCGEMYGAVDADHFNIPDMRGRVPMGAGQGAGLSDWSVGDSVGVEVVVITENEMPAHVHSTHGHLTGLAIAPGELPVSLPSIIPDTTGSTGGSEAHQNMQPSLAITWLIVAY